MHKSIIYGDFRRRTSFAGFSDASLGYAARDSSQASLCVRDRSAIRSSAWTADDPCRKRSSSLFLPLECLIKLPGGDVDQVAAADWVYEWILRVIGMAAHFVSQVKSRPVLSERDIARQRAQRGESMLEVAHGIRIVRVLGESLALR